MSMQQIRLVFACMECERRISASAEDKLIGVHCDHVCRIGYYNRFKDTDLYSREPINGSVCNLLGIP